MINLKNILFLFLVMILQDCSEKNVHTDLQSYHPEINTRELRKTSLANINWKTTGIFNTLYIGKQKSKLSTSEDYKIETNRYYKETNLYHWREKHRNILSYPNLKLSIHIDTNKTINVVNSFLDMKIAYGDLSIQGNTYKSYPVYIKNCNSDTLTIGFGGLIPFSTQAKDSLGEWKTIETTFRHMCGTGLRAINLAPKEIALTSSTIYEGDFKTKIRLQYNGQYSNEIESTINYNQFQNMFGKDGDYKIEYLEEKKRYEQKNN